jgi:two-component system CheB/CheR fusion protein
VLDLRLIAGEAADAVRSQMDDKRLDFTVDLDPEPVWVHGDSARLQQIQINLLNNAVKYTARGGHVSLHLRREGPGAVIRVKDTGAGIAPQMLESVFDLFVQGRHTLDHANGGLGVGLTLVRALVEMHGGTVTAHSDGDGTGSEFAVRLPLSKPAEAALADDRPAVPAPPVGTTVVIVEDNADSREMLCAMLIRAGLACHDAPDGLTGLRLIDEVCPDVVILDVGLPELDGLEVARRIRANPRHAGVRLIALTGYGQTGDRVATTHAGFDHHLVKPVQPSELLALLAPQPSPIRSDKARPAPSPAPSARRAKGARPPGLGAS